MFIKTRKVRKILIVCLCVNDLIFTENDELMFVEFKKSIMLKFDIIDLEKNEIFS